MIKEIHDNEDLEIMYSQIYENFIIRTTDSFIVKNYKIVNKKVIPPFDRKDLIYFAYCENDKIKGGLVFNINMKNTQIGKLINDDNKFNSEKYCEILLLYLEKDISEKIGNIFLDLKNIIFKFNKDNGFTKCLGSCHEKILWGCKFLGWEVLDLIEYDGKKEYILERNFI
jgi:hypothetical protein